MDLPAISFFKSALEMSAMLTVRTRRRTERRTRECETEQKRTTKKQVKQQ